MQRLTVGSVLRSDQAYYGLICERQTLDHGIAFFNSALVGLDEAQQFREVVIEKPGDAARAYAAAEDFFARLGVACRRWAPAEGAAIAELAEQLLPVGFEEVLFDAMTLTRWTAPPVHPRVRVLPARAMRAALEATFDKALERAACVQRLDQPSMDMFVAMCDSKPAGRCALYQVGDIGRVIGPYVVPGFSGCGVEESLLAHVIALGQRLQMRIICTRVSATDGEAHERLGGLGFEADGRMVEYHRRTIKEES